MNITCIVPTKDPNLDVSTLKSQFEEVIVVVDAPPQKGTKHTIFHELHNDFAQQRNFALHQATNDWVLFVDDDETVTQQLADELHAVDTSYDGFWITRTDTFMGKTLQHGETANVRFIRFARKTAGEWTRPVHELWEIKGRVGQIRAPLHHHPHATIASFMEKINRYTTIESKLRKAQGKHFSLFELLVYPTAKFFYNFLLRRGFLDGFAGLSMAYMMSLHSLIVRVKMYETPKS